MDAILARLTSIQNEHQELVSTVDAIAGKVNVLADVKQLQNTKSLQSNGHASKSPAPSQSIPLESPTIRAAEGSPSPEIQARRTSVSSKITLTSYPGQSGVDPCPMSWGAPDAAVRGPVVVSRHPSTIRKRNGKFCDIPLVLIRQRLTDGV